MTFKGALWASFILLSYPLNASVAPPPTTEIAKANLAKAGPIESFDLFQLADGIDDGALNSEAITAAYLARIAAIDDSGPTLNAIIATFPGRPRSGQGDGCRAEGGQISWADARDARAGEG